jgi:hypothetical protein
LDFGALLGGEAGCTKWVLYHHSPDGSETDSDVAASKGGSCNAIAHLLGLLEAVEVFVAIITIWSKSDAKGALAFSVGYALDGYRVVGVIAGGEVDGQFIIRGRCE